MKIAVCIKLVPDTRLSLKLDTTTHRISGLEKMPFVANPDDIAALELAVRIKEREGGEIVVLTVGSFAPVSELNVGDIRLESGGLRNSTNRLMTIDPLRRCLATGADRIMAIGLNDLSGCRKTGTDSGVSACGFRPVNTDSVLIARVLSQAIRQLQADLVFCGERSYDQGNGLVGPVIAELLDMTITTAALDAQVDGKSLIVRRKLEKGERELVKLELPSVLTAMAGSVSPRYYTTPSLVRAFNTNVEALDLAALELSLNNLGKMRSARLLRLHPPRPRVKKVFIPDSSLPPEVRARLAMSGGTSSDDKGKQIVEGDPDNAADKIIQFLQKHKILSSE